MFRTRKIEVLKSLLMKITAKEKGFCPQFQISACKKCKAPSCLPRIH